MRCSVSVFQDSGISVQSAIRASWRGARVSCLRMLLEEQYDCWAKAATDSHVINTFARQLKAGRWTLALRELLVISLGANLDGQATPTAAHSRWYGDSV
jgi:hypothetical protein